MKKYKVIKGKFHVKGYAPDGDSIRFEANDPTNWGFFKWSTKKKNKRKQLRIEAIDALETHYKGYHQPQAFAIAALEALLLMLRIDGVHYSLSMTRIVQANDLKAGFIASAGLDGFNRPISFVFPEGIDLQDGDEMTVSELPIKSSLNYELAERGLVYPTFYTTMEREVFDPFRKAVKKARKTCRGIWAIDRTQGFTLWHTKSIQEDVIILPKLFRRLVSFFDRRGDYAQLPEYLRVNNDKIQLISSGVESQLDKILHVEDRFLHLEKFPEDIAFHPRN